MSEVSEIPNTSEDTESKPVNIDYSTTPIPAFTRRTFLKATGAAIALDTLYSHLPGTTGFTSDFWEKLETGSLNVSTEQLKVLIEKKLLITLLSPKTGFKEFKNTARTYEAIEWDAQRLKTLLGVLGELPPSFYAPHKNKDGNTVKVQVAIVDKTSDGKSDMSGRCLCGNNRESSLVLLTKNSLIQTLPFNQNRAKRLIVHEFTHTLTALSITQFKKEILEPLGIVEEIQLKEIFRSKNLRNGFGLLRDAKMEYGSSNFGEFFSVGAEFYTMGKESFVHVYSQDLGQEKTKQLYDLFKQYIFQGKEY